MKPAPPPMVVYDGTYPLGEIKDHGPHCIKAYVYIGDRKPILIGTYSSRKAAMGAVSEAAERQAVSNEQPPSP